MATLPNGLVTFGPDANCTLELCPLEASILKYRPSQIASILCIVIFSLALIGQLIQGLRSKQWTFMACVTVGCVVEIFGYVGRLMIRDNPFDFPGFAMQIGEHIFI